MMLFDTELGTCGIRWSELGVTRLLMPGSSELTRAVEDDSRDMPQGIADAVQGVTALLAGQQRALREVVLDWCVVDDFRRAVFEAAREIGPGELATYGELARRVGVAGGARAVGRALGSNPWPIIVPCHRVVAADGALTGFSSPGGVGTKRRMLEIEEAPGYAQQPLFA